MILKALINLEDDDDEKSSRTVTVSAHPPYSRRSTVSYAARDLTADCPRRNSGFSATTTKQHIRHSSAFFSIASLARFSQGDDEDKDKQDDEKKYQYEEVQELDPDEERRTRASLFIPYRNHLFHKNKPAVLRSPRLYCRTRCFYCWCLSIQRRRDKIEL